MNIYLRDKAKANDEVALTVNSVDTLSSVWSYNCPTEYLFLCF